MQYLYTSNSNICHGHRVLIKGTVCWSKGVYQFVASCSPRFLFAWLFACKAVLKVQWWLTIFATSECPWARWEGYFLPRSVLRASISCLMWSRRRSHSCFVYHCAGQASVDAFAIFRAVQHEKRVLGVGSALFWLVPFAHGCWLVMCGQKPCVDSFWCITWFLGILCWKWGMMETSNNYP